MIFRLIGYGYGDGYGDGNGYGNGTVNTSLSIETDCRVRATCKQCAGT